MGQIAHLPAPPQEPVRGICRMNAEPHRLADELENEGELTKLANSVLERAGARGTTDTEEFLRESERTIETGSDW